MNQVKIGNFLKELRKEEGIIQEQLAEILFLRQQFKEQQKVLHINRKEVSNLENAKRRMHICQ